MARRILTHGEIMLNRAAATPKSYHVVPSWWGRFARYSTSTVPVPLGHDAKLSQSQAAVKSEGNILTDTLNRHHSYLRISLTERCNLRCQYCMPEEGVQLTPQNRLLSSAEIVTLAGIFAEEGVSKIRLTGGEPLVRSDLADIIRSLKAVPGVKTVGITTNALTLSRKLDSLMAAGLDALNISLDTLIKPKFEHITRRRGHDRVLQAIQDASSSGHFDRVKVNCVVMRGMNEEEVPNFVELTREWPIDIRFIEYMPFDGNKWLLKKFVPYQEMLNSLRKSYPELVRISDQPNDTSKAWQVPGFLGQIGFITSMSKNFCGSCNRLRLTADGNLKVCLFGNTELNLRDALRDSALNKDDIKELIGEAVMKKKPRHAGMLKIKESANRPMILIGG
ncbi:hypothetical protein TCAL_09593 [Tigriopus californicus]|uniref:GTP 3',8-cyclase n=2 Tax=Tigriopus californicus TaxID=6832 RepID=A0A553PEX8_TIGCA|nr:hypothetical protein TCAL_09593 [Tigriopus californicus]|eukprot:TCALIF_09593-PA protein Name:"Similar to MOCS1 Molybdenum cofactor biosynthesis protein 1 (Homo sapiens)" AED:0.03 eAED:0.04 QI:0/-1/0/1/-1/1/1/0/391